MRSSERWRKGQRKMEQNNDKQEAGQGERVNINVCPKPFSVLSVTLPPDTFQISLFISSPHLAKSLALGFSHQLISRLFISFPFSLQCNLSQQQQKNFFLMLYREPVQWSFTLSL